jgi:amino acid transporter
MSLAVFPVAFTQYLMVFLPNLDQFSQVVVKGLFVVFLIATNILGVKAAGRTNDVLTVVKLAPLIFFLVIGLSYIATNVAAVSTLGIPILISNGAIITPVVRTHAGADPVTIPGNMIMNTRSDRRRLGYL